MKTQEVSFDLVVCGGGLAGLCAAIAAARGGVKTALIQDRPVLGGNSSSEIRVTVHGAGQHHYYARETGIISEMLIEERARNHEEINENGWTNSVWDLVLYDWVQREPNLTLHLNTSVIDVLMSDGSRASQSWASRPAPVAQAGYLERPACNPTARIQAVITRVANAETEIIFHANQFMDCTGDALVADLAGCGWRWGTESFEETGEPHAPPRASADTMGNSIHIRARDMGRPCPFIPPDWAVKHTDPDYFYKQGRVPSDPRGGFWWIEIGVPWDTIHDNETIRHELTRHALGVWDWMKNHDPVMKKRCASYALDWIGQVPGKRESRRVFGKTWLTENDIQSLRVFPDEVAYGGWFVDLHTPGGLLAPSSEPSAAEGYRKDSEYGAKSYVGPYGIPLGIMLSRDVENLAMAGRNVSVTHAALGTVRVMGTCALMGQALGTAYAMAKARGLTLDQLRTQDPAALQQQLLRDGCWLPNVRHQDHADLARQASITASSEHRLLGAGPYDRWVSNGLTSSRSSEAGEKLQKILGQMIASDGGAWEWIEIFVDNPTPSPISLPLELRAVPHLWSYGVQAGEKLAQGEVSVPPGGGWVRWRTALSQTPRGWLRLQAGPQPELAWRVSPKVLPGHMALYAISATKMRKVRGEVTLCFRLSRAQQVCAPAEVISGCTRPQIGVERWISDPAEPLPQYLELRWPQPVRLSQVELTFPGHLMRELHATPPMYRDPQTPRDYRLQIPSADGETWNTLLTVTNNYTRHRRHSLNPIETDRLRIVVDATNGDPSAQIIEVRVYEVGQGS